MVSNQELRVTLYLLIRSVASKKDFYREKLLFLRLVAYYPKNDKNDECNDQNVTYEYKY